MSDLTAIDVLIDPDAATIERARTVNARMLQSMPQGWALDDTHQPHITTLQRYVRSADLDQVYEAVEKTLAQTDMTSLSYQAVKITHADWGFPGYGPTVLLVEVSPEVLDFQANLIEAVRPFTGSGGTAQAYVRTEAEPDINQQTIDYIEHYVPQHSGTNFVAHVTVGLARLDDLAKIEAETFEPLPFSPAVISVYQLGSNGTAARHLKSWTA